MFQPPLLRRSSAMFQPPLLRGPASRLSAQARRERCIYDTCTTHGPHTCFAKQVRNRYETGLHQEGGAEWQHCCREARHAYLRT